MAKLARIFISERRLRSLQIALALLFSLLILAAIAGIAIDRAVSAMDDAGSAGIERYERLQGNIDTAFDALRETVTAQPCTLAFREEVRRVAFLPDGLSQFLYAPGGKIACTGNILRFSEPLDLGRPDIERPNSIGVDFWLDRDLGSIGLEGLTGTVVVRGDFGIVVPPEARPDVTRPLGWGRSEAVLVGGDGRWWHRAGQEGVYAEAEAARRTWFPFDDGKLRRRLCDADGMLCIASEVPLLGIITHWPIATVVALWFAALLGAWLASLARRVIERAWTFEARFRRHLDADSVVCAYQPIMHLKSGAIVGCEVLARWRDVDDTIVFPDRFIGIVERLNMTRPFTQLVVDRAFAELSAHTRLGQRLQVNFNIFPRDLDAEALSRMLAAFTAAPDRFDVVVEIVESDALEVGHAQRQIEALRRAGIKTYIDDFGAGYSNIHNLAALSVDGVKLDRAFAMAPQGSLMERMLDYAVDMISESGRVMVVEGIETEARLTQLRESATHVDFVQGYHIARPLDIHRFAELASRAAHASARKCAA